MVSRGEEWSHSVEEGLNFVFVFLNFYAFPFTQASNLIVGLLSVLNYLK